MNSWDDGEHNAKVESTSLGYEDHGVLTYWLHLDYGGVHQGFGGVALDQYDKEQKHRQHSPVAGLSIEKILKVCGASSWEKIPGTYVRAIKENGLVKGIKHVLKDDIVFYPEKDFKPYLPEKGAES